MTESRFKTNVVLFMLLYNFVTVSSAQEFSPEVGVIPPDLQPKTTSLTAESMVDIPASTDR